MKLTEGGHLRLYLILMQVWRLGKTTLTEKLLLFGGAIQDAGAVKARADQRKATSDWMEIEKQRGISVTSTVLSFEYEHNATKYHINLLDTPGHQDFSEDTYRTLSAADNCVMLIDAAKGIEDRTRKLYEVCRMKDLPIFTFANKMDRSSLSPFEIVDQLEKEFKFKCIPVNWPIGDGDEFQGVLDRMTMKVHLYQRGDRRKKITANIIDYNDKDMLLNEIGQYHYDKLVEDISILTELIPELSIQSIQRGEQSPLFFGSAMTNFGVELFFKTFLTLSQKPIEHDAIVEFDGFDSSSENKLISPYMNEFSGFIFKLQANLDPKHRDRMAFIRICSGVFHKGMKITHSRTKKSINLSSAQSIFAQDRESVVEAYPGDIIGVHNPGHFLIGDTIYSGTQKICFPRMPNFSPERFAYIRNANPSAYKKFHKGLNELLDEGAVQMLYDRNNDGNGLPMLAAVGQLQLEVVEYRLKTEYNVDVKLETLPTYTFARWVGGGWNAVNKASSADKLFGVHICRDRWDHPVILFRNMWKITQLENDVEYLQLEPWAMPPR